MRGWSRRQRRRRRARDKATDAAADRIGAAHQEIGAEHRQRRSHELRIRQRFVRRALQVAQFLQQRIVAQWQAPFAAIPNGRRLRA